MGEEHPAKLTVRFYQVLEGVLEAVEADMKKWKPWHEVDGSGGRLCALEEGDMCGCGARMRDVGAGMWVCPVAMDVLAIEIARANQMSGCDTAVLCKEYLEWGSDRFAMLFSNWLDRDRIRSMAGTKEDGNLVCLGGRWCEAVAASSPVGPGPKVARVAASSAVEKARQLERWLQGRQVMVLANGVFGRGQKRCMAGWCWKWCWSSSGSGSCRGQIRGSRVRG